MNRDQKIDKIVDYAYPALANGQETIDSILETHPQYAGELRPRLESILWLIKSRQTFEPQPGFITSSRKYLEYQLESIKPHGFWQRLSRHHTPQRWIFNLASPILLILLLILIVNSLVLSAQLSIPGDPLYSTKLALEDFRLALTFDRVDKANLSIQLSRERTTEFVELVLEGDYELIPSAAERMETEMIASLHSINNIPQDEQGADIPMIKELRETLTNEIFMLDMLKSTAPLSAHQGIELAIQAAQSGLMVLH